MTARREITLSELFTREEVERALALYREHGHGRAFVDAVVREIVDPALPRINAATGQGNVARYWAYALGYAIGEAERRGRI